MFIGWLMCISAVLLPHSPCRSTTANAPASRQMPIASVVRRNYKKKKVKEISSAKLWFENEFIIELTLPELRIQEGEIFIDCYIDRTFFKYDEKDIFDKDLTSFFDNKLFLIKGITNNGTEIIYNNVFLQSSSFPSFKFSFLCIDYSTEYISRGANKSDIQNSQLSSLIIDGINPQFTKTSEVKRKRFIFGQDDSSILSFNIDNSELTFRFNSRKRSYHLKIGIIKNTEKENSIIVKFYGDCFIQYRVYQRFKDSIRFFISYLAGNNIIIRNENYIINNEKYHFESCYFFRTYSNTELTKLNTNAFLPIQSPHFRHENIIQDYLKTLPNYLFIDKKLNISEVIYLINQSKQVNMESSFFILLIAVEKLANSLINSDLINYKENNIIDKELFESLKQELIKTFGGIFSGKITTKQMDQLKSKIGNLNIKNNTDSKIDMLLDFCEIVRSGEIDLLFPQLRNLAIHQGEISVSQEDAYKNYQTLFVLTNSIICNLLQYKGTRFIEHKDSTNFITKKEEYKLSYNNYR